MADCVLPVSYVRLVFHTWRELVRTRATKWRDVKNILFATGSPSGMSQRL